MVMRALLMCSFYHVFQVPATGYFYDSGFAPLLARYVYGKRVGYQVIKNDRAEMDALLQQLNETSPDNKRDLFARCADQLTYRINAYTAFNQNTIIENYPLPGIKDINFIGVTVWFNKNLRGGIKFSFKSPEDDIIRERFMDLRIHFALNCASLAPAA